MKKNYYMKVTADEYELPLAVGESLDELAELLHITPRAITRTMKRVCKNRVKWKYIAFEVEDENGE